MEVPDVAHGRIAAAVARDATAVGIDATEARALMRLRLPEIAGRPAPSAAGLP